MKKLKIFALINFFTGVIFSFFCISFHADISLAAFPLSLIFNVVFFYIGYVLFLKKQRLNLLLTVNRFYQYQPFVYITSFVLQRAGKTGGCPFAIDFISVILWVIVLVTSVYISYKLNEKRAYSLCKEWAAWRKSNPPVKAKGAKRVIIEILEWVDAIVQAVYIILLVNIFIFQLYEIPSESMVPEFLIKDRVVVFKTLAGPKFPLSEVGLPYGQKYKRGDIVVLRNPHYADDWQSEVKTVLSNFVSMITLTKVQINRDEYGDIKADPLVKRVCGEPGEQLLMMDGKLYARTAENPEFKKVDTDEKFAAWDLNPLSPAMKKKIERIPMSRENVQATLDIEEARRNLDLELAAIECNSLAEEFALYAKGKEVPEVQYKSLLSGKDLYEYNLFNNINDISVKLLSSDGGSQWFKKFITSWTNLPSPLRTYTEKNGAVTGNELVGGDLYSDANFRLNVMAKLYFARLLLINARRIVNDIPLSELRSNAEFNNAFNDIEKLNVYLVCLDQRNMPLFPANDASGNAQYIPENCYFMMGDNRYNSLDLRHSYDMDYVPLTSYDDMPVLYYSNMAPQYVNRSRMLGKAAYRFWPLDRAGVPGGIRSGK